LARRCIVSGCFERAKGLLLGNIGALHAVAAALLEKEVLDGQEIDDLLKGNLNGLAETVQG